MRFSSPNGIIALTEERKRHILAFHPDVTPYLRYFPEALTSPDVIVPSAHDPSVLIYYWPIPKRKVRLVVVIKAGLSPFVLTAYLAKKSRKATL